MIVIIKSMFALCLSLFFIFFGYKKKSLSASGALMAIIVGYIHAVSSFTNLTSLLSFFVLGSWVTKFGRKIKEKFDDDYKEGGQRTWVQVISNSCLSTIASLIYVSEIGIRFQDLPLNYQKNPVASMATVAVISSLAACCGDTFSSEVGSAFSHGDPRLILGWRKVPRGTNGGVSVIGTLASAFGGLLIGIFSYLSITFTSSSIDLQGAPNQWPILVLATLSGVAGSSLDSFLGATLQYTGLNLTTGKIVNQPGTHVKHISGLDVLDNHSVNLISSFITGAAMVFVPFYLLPPLLQLF